MPCATPHQPSRLAGFVAAVCLVIQLSVPMAAQAIIQPLSMLTDSAQALRNYEKALSLYEKDSLERALDLAGVALQFAMASGRQATERASLELIAGIYDRQGQPGDALPYYLRAADILQTTGDTAGLLKINRQIAQCYQQEKVFAREAEYHDESLALLTEDDSLERAELHVDIGIALLQEGMPDSSLFWFAGARKLYRRSGPEDSRILQYMVRALNEVSRHEEAITYNEILFERYAARSDKRLMSAVKNNIAYNLSRLREYDRAAVAYGEAIEYGRAADLPPGQLGAMLMNAGIVRQNMEDSKGAIGVFRQAIEAFDQSSDAAERSRAENIIALIYYHEGDLYNAGIFSKRAIESAQEAGDAEKISVASLTYSRILREGNDPIRALEYYEKYLHIRDSLQLEEKLLEQALARRRDELEKSENDLKIKLKEEQVRELAIQQLTLQLEKEEREKELMRREKDLQLLEQERLRQSLVITRQQNAVEKERRENRILEQEKRISDLRLEQEQRKQKEQEQEIVLLEQQQRLDQLELNRQKNSQKVLIGFSILGLMITGLILVSLISSRRKNILLARQKVEIEEKNLDLENKNEEIITQRDEIEAQRDLVFKQKEEIELINQEVMKSIEYAKKIQTSTLPDLSSLNTTISDHFVLFRPRDIVSGDFFWAANVENTTVLTVSDCTGHGVPGAFMSMLGMSLLKEIVLKEYITLPGVILRRLRKGIIESLDQKGVAGEQRDGMDMALLTIDHQTQTLQYAGAYNPLYLVRLAENAPPAVEDVKVFQEEFGNGYKLYEVRADKMPIAHFEQMDKFRTHEISILKGDRAYIFTDGYADQFGGPKGKKFMYKPFKRLLLKNAQLPMKEQQASLDETLEAWMRNVLQVDDICVMGVAF